MSTHKHIDLICVAVLVCTLLLTVLFINGERLGLRPIVDGDAESSSDSAFFTRNDRDGSWSTAGAARITLSGLSASVSGGGAYVYDGNVVIAQAGRYVISGALNDGSVIVSADSSAKVWILLDGADITCSDDACLRVEQAEKVFLTLADGTQNSMTSGAEYSEAALADNTGGVIFSHDDLTVNGSGSLTLTAAYKHGIDVNDELTITGGSITIDAPQDGIHVNDGLNIEEASLTIRAGDEGLNLQGPDTLLYIASGSIDIDSTGAAVKSAADLLIEGGSFELRTDADGLHSGGSITVTGGALTIRAADDGIHADSGVSITGGSILISECYEGIEALTIDISGGEIELYPTDDGLNANGGFGGFGMFGRRGDTAVDTTVQTQTTETWIHISGGSLTIVNAAARDADGIDSNGDIVISGGVIRVSLTSSGSNDAIDYASENGGSCVITGGELIACGSSAMAEGFSDASTQCVVLHNLGNSAAAGTTVRVLDGTGREILSYAPPCDFSSVSLSSPAFKLGETYTVVVGDEAGEITFDSVSISSGSAGAFGGFGGMGGRGRQQWQNADGAERPSDMSGWGGQPGETGGMGSQPGNADGAMPTPPDFGGEMPDFSDMPTPPDFGGEMPDFSDMPAPPDMGGMGGAVPGSDGEAPDPSAMPQNMGGGHMRHDDMPEAMQNAAEEAAELAIEETLPAGPQPVSTHTWIMLAACALALMLGILIAVKYRQ
ncbi:MAG: carbohydrate-binding domain-containing protein [Oscillospiraceae bacterium]|nr:carbohydrate-binding domain-containing protein [Oscillospiraceae bacterium]